MLAIALGLAVALPPLDVDRALAEKLLDVDQVEPVALTRPDDAGGPPAFRSGDRAVLFFDQVGVQGPIRGAIVIDADRITRLVLLRSSEGLDHTALSGGSIQESFRGQTAKPPLIVEAVSGATISSQKLTDAVSARLKLWQALAP
jgi:hypothetical protein